MVAPTNKIENFAARRCVRTTPIIVGTVRPLLQSNRTVRKTNDYRNKNGGRRVNLPYHKEIKNLAEKKG